MSQIEFKPWGKIARLNREVIITEKIDGTNAAIIFEDITEGNEYLDENGRPTLELTPTGKYEFGAQSRNRLITPEDDNYGFARWVYDNHEVLYKMLGPGRHYGEWWGGKIQRGYGISGDDKRFSLFNLHRYMDVDFTALPNVGLVPVIHTKINDYGVYAPTTLDDVPLAIEYLKKRGSLAAPGFMDPEGVVVYHIAADTLFKVTCKDDDKPKGK